MFRRFKRTALFVAVLITVGAFLYKLLDFLFSISEWVTEKKGLWARLWAGATSSKGSVIVTGLLALVVVCIWLADRRLETQRDLKWKRRKRILEFKSRGLIKSKTKTLTGTQRDELFSFQKKIKDLHYRALHGPLEGLLAEIPAWEQVAGEFLETVWDREHRALVMDAPFEPASRAGFAQQNYLIGWTHKRLEGMNALIDELRRT